MSAGLDVFDDRVKRIRCMRFDARGCQAGETRREEHEAVFRYESLAAPFAAFIHVVNRFKIEPVARFLFQHVNGVAPPLH